MKQVKEKLIFITNICQKILHCLSKDEKVTEAHRRLNVLPITGMQDPNFSVICGV